MFTLVMDCPAISQSTIQQIDNMKQAQFLYIFDVSSKWSKLYFGVIDFLRQFLQYDYFYIMFLVCYKKTFFCMKCRFEF